MFHVAQSAHTPIEPAQPGYIDNRLLGRLVEIGDEISKGRISEEQAELFLLCAPACLDELLEYRLRAAASLDLVPEETNVIHLHGPRDRT